MNNSITVSKLAQNPLLAYSISMPEPKELELSEYEESAFPAIFGNLTGLSISRVIPKYKLGRIWSFDIAPRQSEDPIIIYSPVGNLSLYYSVWADVMSKGRGMFINKKIKKFQEAVRLFVETSEASGLTLHETVFATSVKRNIPIQWKFKSFFILIFLEDIYLYLETKQE